MRKLVILLFLLDVPIWLGGALLGHSVGLVNFHDIRKQLAALDLVSDALGGSGTHGAARPDLVASVEAHRAEIDELRVRVCSLLNC